MKRILPVLFLMLSLTPSLPAQDKEKEPLLQRIEWTANVAARGFLVVFFREGVEVFRRETIDTWLYFSLPPGTYTWTVTIINKFGKEGGQSSPQELVIEKIHQPLVKRGIPSEIWSDQKSLEMTIELYQLHNKGDVFLTQGSLRVKGEILFRSDDRIQVRFDLTGFLPGSCDLELQNPAGVSGFSSGILLIKEKRTPLFGKLSSGFLYAGSLYTDVVLTGTGFEPGMTAVFRDGTKEILPAQIDVVSQTEARLWLDLRTTGRGHYSLRLDNPSGLGSGGAEPVLTVDYTEEYYWKERNFGSDLLLGAVAFIVSDMDGSGTTAIIPGISLKIDIDFTDKIPFMRGWCFEIRGDYAYIPSDKMTGALMAAMALVYRTRFNSNFNFFGKGGMGGQWTMGDNNENGPLFFCAAGIDLNFFLHLIVQLEADYYLFVHEGGSSSFFPVSLSIGYRF